MGTLVHKSQRGYEYYERGHMRADNQRRNN
jgi:hypothetical protein